MAANVRGAAIAAPPPTSPANVCHASSIARRLGQWNPGSLDLDRGRRDPVIGQHVQPAPARPHIGREEGDLDRLRLTGQQRSARLSSGRKLALRLPGCANLVDRDRTRPLVRDAHRSRRALEPDLGRRERDGHLGSRQIGRPRRRGVADEIQRVRLEHRAHRARRGHASRDRAGLVRRRAGRPGSASFRSLSTSSNATWTARQPLSAAPASAWPAAARSSSISPCAI